MTDFDTLIQNATDQGEEAKAAKAKRASKPRKETIASQWRGASGSDAARTREVLEAQGFVGFALTYADLPQDQQDAINRIISRCMMYAERERSAAKKAAR